jgi:hypothetical protein
MRFFRVLPLLVATAFLGSLAPAAGYPQASATITAVAATRLPMFDSESAAQAHCPSDTVVWLNTKTGIWHEKGMRWYGRTRQGAYVCRKEAAAAGFRDTRNGQ